MNAHRIPRALWIIASIVLFAPLAAAGQDSAAAAASRLGALPVFGSAPETGFQYGVTVFRIHRAGEDATTRPSVDQFSVTNTAKQQRKASIQTERWTAGNVWRFRLRLEYQDYPLPYFGVGPSTESEAEEWYGAEGGALHLQLHRRLWPSTYLMGGYRLGRVSLRDLSPSGELVQGTVIGSSGGVVSQLQGGLLRDSRDNIFSARGGALAQATVSVSTSALGADYDFTRVDIDLRRYVALARYVLAGQVQFQASAGDTPFDQLPAIGADTAIRGYTRGRYRDLHLLSGQLELRTPYWRRVGLVAFAGAGTVAERAGDLTSHVWQPGVGAGLRVLLFPRDRSAIRVDFGTGRGSSGLYVGLNEAF